MAIFCICFSPASDDSYVLPETIERTDRISSVRLSEHYTCLSAGILLHACLSFCLNQKQGPPFCCLFSFFKFSFAQALEKGSAKGFATIHSFVRPYILLGLQIWMKTDRIRTDITDIIFVFIFLVEFGFEYG